MGERQDLPETVEPSPSGFLSCEQGFEPALAGNDDDDDDPDKKQGTVNRFWNVPCEGRTSGIQTRRNQGVQSCDPTGITEIWCLLINSGTPAPALTFIKRIN